MDYDYINESDQISERDILERELKLSKRIPWNIFYEKNWLFIGLFILATLVTVASIVRSIFIPIKENLILWELVFLLLYLFLLPCIVFFRKYTFFILSLFLFLCTVFLVGIYPFTKKIFTDIISLVPFLKTISDIIPLSDLSSNIFSLWQVLYNTFLIPIMAILLLFYKSPPQEFIEYFYEQKEKAEEEKEKQNNLENLASLLDEPK